jgi:co-chaperonin GroES (HSP10)
MNITLFDGELLVEMDVPDTTTEAGILLPDRAHKPKYSGTVVLAAASMKEGQPARFQAGDRVHIRRHQVGAWLNVEVENKTYMLIRSEAVWAKECPSSSPAATKAKK